MACCTCCSLKSISVLGFIFTILFGLLAVAGIVLGGLQYKMLDFSWIESTDWSALGIIAIVAIVIIAFATIFGIIEFCCCQEKCCFPVIFLIVELIVLLFALAIAILGLVSSAVGVVDDYVGCNSEFKGILNFWDNFDYLFQYLDYGLCSDNCKCGFIPTITDEFLANTSAVGFYNQWEKGGDNIVLSNCSGIESKVSELFSNLETDTEKKHTLNVTQFGKYWKIVEEEFNCTGWCKTSYSLKTDLDGNALTTAYTGMFYKYLYSGINRGIVTHLGCMRSIIEWLPPLLQAYGIVGVVASVLCFLSWFLALMLLCNCYKEKKDKK